MTLINHFINLHAILMSIDEFFLKSVGEWNSMRSGHSLAFQEFEEIRSKIKISSLRKNDPRLVKLINDNLIPIQKITNPFIINWESKSDWDDKSGRENSSGESLLIPLATSDFNGKIIRSLGYSEPIQITSSYKILEDGTLVISSDYNQIITEERIWFISENLRSRSSVTRSLNSKAILQTSYASEVRVIKTNL